MDKPEYERIRRLVKQRMAEQKTSVTPFNVPAFWLSTATTMIQSLSNALRVQQEIGAGIPQGPANAPSSWDALERSLGKDLTDKLKRK